MFVYSVGNLQLENHVMSNAHQFCHDSGFSCREGCFFYQDSGDLKQLLGDGGTRSRGKGQSVIGLPLVQAPALPQNFILASGGISRKRSLSCIFVW